MKWLSIAGIFIKQALKRIDLAVVLMYVIDLAEFIIGLSKTLIDNFILDCIKAVIEIYRNRNQQDTVYKIAMRMSIAIADIAEGYEEFSTEPVARQGVELLKASADKFRSADFK